MIMAVVVIILKFAIRRPRPEGEWGQFTGLPTRILSPLATQPVPPRWWLWRFSLVPLV